MKYIAPAVLNAANATALIQGGKNGNNPDSSNPLDQPSTAAGYPADE
jgi:hypothetical protein